MRCQQRAKQQQILEDGYHYGFIVTFTTPQARDACLNDRNHRPVAEAIRAAAERIVVFDI